MPSYDPFAGWQQPLAIEVMESLLRNLCRSPARGKGMLKGDPNHAKGRLHTIRLTVFWRHCEVVARLRASTVFL